MFSPYIHVIHSAAASTVADIKRAIVAAEGLPPSATETLVLSNDRILDDPSKRLAAVGVYPDTKIQATWPPDACVGLPSV